MNETNGRRTKWLVQYTNTLLWELQLMMMKQATSNSKKLYIYQSICIMEFGAIIGTTTTTTTTYSSVAPSGLGGCPFVSLVHTNKRHHQFQFSMFTSSQCIFVKNNI